MISDKIVTSYDVGRVSRVVAIQYHETEEVFDVDLTRYQCIQSQWHWDSALFSIEYRHT